MTFKKCHSTCRDQPRMRLLVALTSVRTLSPRPQQHFYVRHPATSSFKKCPQGCSEGGNHSASGTVEIEFFSVFSADVLIINGCLEVHVEFLSSCGFSEPNRTGPDTC